MVVGKIHEKLQEKYRKNTKEIQEKAVKNIFQDTERKICDRGARAYTHTIYPNIVGYNLSRGSHGDSKDTID